jgi:cytochrome b6-f complex iron-sulfur subunit
VAIRPPEIVESDPTRRAFLNRALVAALAVFGVAFGGSSVATLWPRARNGLFGGTIDAGNVDDLVQQINATGTPVYNVQGRFYVVAYDTRDPSNRYVSAGAASHGLMVLSQKCSHLGCRVPFCSASKWFECPCHGAQFNMAGEVKRGPAPAGMWRYPFRVNRNGRVLVDTSRRIAQPPAGTDTTRQQPAGPFCVPS